VSSYLWPWILFFLIWLALNAVRIYQKHRERVDVVRRKVSELQRCDPAASKEAEAEFDNLSVKAFQELDVGQRGKVSSQELRPFLNRISEKEGREATEKVLVDKPQGIGLKEFQELVRDRVCQTDDTALEGTRTRRRRISSQEAVVSEMSETRGDATTANAAVPAAVAEAAEPAAMETHEC
jgi:hypothetical protein